MAEVVMGTGGRFDLPCLPHLAVVELRICGPALGTTGRSPDRTVARGRGTVEEARLLGRQAVSGLVCSHVPLRG